MRLLTLAIVLTAAQILAACVTINIYFPASAAEKAADKIIDEIWQSRGDANPSAPVPAAAPPATNEKSVKP